MQYIIITRGETFSHGRCHIPVLSGFPAQNTLHNLTVPAEGEIKIHPHSKKYRFPPNRYIYLHSSSSWQLLTVTQKICIGPKFSRSSKQIFCLYVPPSREKYLNQNVIFTVQQSFLGHKWVKRFAGSLPGACSLTAIMTLKSIVNPGVNQTETFPIFEFTFHQNDIFLSELLSNAIVLQLSCTTLMCYIISSDQRSTTSLHCVKQPVKMICGVLKYDFNISFLVTLHAFHKITSR